MASPPTEPSALALLQQRILDLEEENRALRGLAEQRSSRNALFIDISHELRTPLTLSIAPLEELLTRGGDLDGETRQGFLETIYNNQLRLLRLINDLLDLARVDAGRVDATFQLADVAAAVRFYASTLSAAARLRRLTLAVDVEPEGAEVLLFVDRGRFEKIVMNLLSNAFKYTPAGGDIRVVLRDEGDEVHLVVRDTGQGIPEDRRARIFERFRRAEAPADTLVEGTGLGLALVKEYAQLHGGSVEVESAEGQGSTFRVRFRKGDAHLDPEQILSGMSPPPEGLRARHLAGEHLSAAPGSLAGEHLRATGSKDTPGAAEGSLARELPGAPGSLVSESSPLSPSSLPSSSGNARSALSFEPEDATVLVVDDVADMRRFLAHVLGRRYRVALARDGIEGLERARELRPTLILSDVTMPRSSGYELCAAIRSDPALARTPFILLSARADIARKLEGLEHGADDYLTKPFHASELLARVRNQIRIHHQERGLMEALRALEERDRSLTEDLQQAREFQRSILPPALEPPGLTLDILYQPQALVGGDLYDIQILDEHRIRGFLADATGHGVQASLTTMLIKSGYEAAKRDDASPSEILARLNDRIAGTYSSLGLRFTGVCFEIDRLRRRVRYAVGAHPAPLLVHHGHARELDGEGPFLGLLPGSTFPLQEAPFGPGDRFYLYTDGLTEEWDPRGESFGEGRLQHAIEQASDQGALAGPFVYDAVSRFISGSGDQYDDMTLLGVWWGQPPRDNKERR